MDTGQRFCKKGGHQEMKGGGGKCVSAAAVAFVELLLRTAAVCSREVHSFTREAAANKGGG